MFDLTAIQSALREFDIDAWLLCDFRGQNPLAKNVVGFPDGAHQTRRWMYLIPREGEPKKLVHRIESGTLDHLPGEKRMYLPWQELEAGVAWLLSGPIVARPQPKIAMEYSPRNAIPYLSKVDAGTVELVRANGCVPVSSGDVIQRFTAVWDDERLELFAKADRTTTSAYDVVWKFLRDESQAGRQPHETDVQDLIMAHFAKNGCVTDHRPIIGVNGNGGDPHYSPEKGKDAVVKTGDLVLVDLWCKADHPRGVYSDLTRMGYMGSSIPKKFADIFTIVADARDAAIKLVEERFAAKQELRGWEVDEACRKVIVDAGYGPAFCHRTGHSIGFTTHGDGANMDNLETHDDRLVLAGTCFSIEPGIYLPEQDMGFRSEIDMLISRDGKPQVFGGRQREIVAVLK